MPVFQLARTIPGLDAQATVTLNVAGDTQQVTLRLNDPLLFQSANASPIVLTAASNGQQLTLSSNFSSPVSFAGGQLLLRSITMTISFKNDGSGSMVYDNTAPAPITVQGQVDWTGDVPALLQVPNQVIPLSLGWQAGNGGRSGFALQLQSPLSVSRLSLSVQAAALGIEAVPEEDALVLSLQGQAALDPALVNRLKGPLEKLFGAGHAPDLTPPAVRVRYKLKAPDGAPAAPVGLPSIDFLTDWLNASSLPDLSGIPEQMALKLGSPMFSFSFPHDLTELPSMSFQLLKSKIRFPDIAGIQAFDLIGNLGFEDLPNGDWKLRFSPALPGGIDLPEIIKFLLARISWLAGQLPDLDGLLDLIEDAQSDLDLYRMFKNLLPASGGITPDFLTNIFKPAFEAIVRGVNAPTIDSVFRIAFRALESAMDDVAAAVWDVWFNLQGSAQELSKLMMLLWRDLSSGAYELMLKHLFSHSLFNLGMLLSELFQYAGAHWQDGIETFLRFWASLLGAAVKHANPGDLAQALIGLLKSPPSSIGTFRFPSDISFFSGISGVDLPNLKLPAADLIVGLAMSFLTVITDLPLSLPLKAAAGTRLGKLFAEFASAIRSFFAGIELPQLDAVMVTRLLHAIWTNAEGDEQAELMLLRLGRIFPLGIVFALIGAVHNLFTSPAPWVNLMFKSIESNPALKVKRFPAPKPGNANGQKPVKYLIISDVHRDASSDLKPPMEFGAIEHFAHNSNLYADILDYAYQHDFTVLEGGDSEELWFIRDFSTYQGPAHMLSEIIQSHTAVYDRLEALHREGRYFRIYGNHDSQLRQPNVEAVLKQRFEIPGNNGSAPVPFTIYDYFIIDGVKTLDDFGVKELAEDIWTSLTTDERIDQLLQKLAVGRIGLDAMPYSEKKPMIVTHGHQFDFWNCDENSLVGKLIANSVGVPVDMFNDPWEDMKGIAFGGAPLVNLDNMLAELPVFNNFPAYDPARKFAHKIQHMNEQDRLLINDLFYLEWIPALVGSLALPLNVKDETTQTVYEWDDWASTPAHRERFFEYFGNQICVGHTHFPQCQPYFDTAALLLSPPLKKLTDMVLTEIEGLIGFKPPLNFLRSKYYNSGTAGWMEGVIWGIMIDETGLAQLVYWTKDTKIDRPQTMDWQIQNMDPAIRAALDAKIGEVSQKVRGIIDKMKEVIAATVTFPLELAIAFADELSSSSISHELNEIDVSGLSLDNAVEQVRAEAGKIGSALLHLIGSLLYRFKQGVSGQNQGISLSVPVSAEMESQLTAIRNVLAGIPGLPADKILHLAAVWLAAGQHLPFVDGMSRASLIQDYPVLWNLLMLLPLLPPGGISIGGIAISPQVTIGQGKLKLDLTMS